MGLTTWVVGEVDMDDPYMFTSLIRCDASLLRVGDVIGCEIDPEVWDRLSIGWGSVDDLSISGGGRMVRLRFMGLLEDRPEVEFRVDGVEYVQ
jgi:hypothetical protein